MKKLTSLIAILLVACVAAQATPLFQETFSTRRGSTYIDKVQLSSSTAWPYASQWFTGYTGTQGAVSGNQFDHDYTAVASYGVSVRGKQLNEQSTSTVGLFFSSATKQDGTPITAAQNYVRFEGALPNVPEGAYLKFEICSSEADGGDLGAMQVKINNSMAEVPATTLKAKCITSEVAISLPAGQLDSIKFAFDSEPTHTQKFISRIWIDTEAPVTAIDNVTAAPAKATKVIENGQLFIIREGIKYNAAGAIVK